MPKCDTCKVEEAEFIEPKLDSPGPNKETRWKRAEYWCYRCVAIDMLVQREMDCNYQDTSYIADQLIEGHAFKGYGNFTVEELREEMDESGTTEVIPERFIKV